MSERSPYRHVACAIDNSEASERALAEAVRLWGGGPGRLSVVHVAEPPIALWLGAAAAIPAVMDQDWQAGEAALLTRVTATLPGAEAVLLTGDPDAQVVCDWARAAQVDLLVAGVYRGVAARALYGSFSHYLAYHAPCPVLLVGPGAHQRAERDSQGGRRVRAAGPEHQLSAVPA